MVKFATRLGYEGEKGGGKRNNDATGAFQILIISDPACSRESHCRDTHFWDYVFWDRFHQ